MPRTTLHTTVRNAILAALLLGIGLLIGAGQPCQAQSLFGGSTSSGRSGSSNVSVGGTTNFSQAGSTGRTTSSGSSGSMFSGSGGQTTGAGGRTAGAAGQNGQANPLGGSMMNAADGSLGLQMMNNTGFIGAGNSNGFIGSRTAGTGSNLRGMSTQFGGMQLNNNTNQRGNNGRGQEQSPGLQIRPQLKLGFDAPSTPPVLTDTVQTRLASLPSLAGRADGVVMSVDEAGLVTLNGRVANEADRRMVEAVVRLEPGVRRIDNQLQVAP